MRARWKEEGGEGKGWRDTERMKERDTQRKKMQEQKEGEQVFLSGCVLSKRPDECAACRGGVCVCVCVCVWTL